MNPGLNAPLFHPWCRCGTYPIVPRDKDYAPASDEDINEFQRLSDELYSSLSGIEKSAIDSYTHFGYEDINTSLISEKVQDKAHIIDRVIDRYQMPKNIISYRSEELSFIADKKINDGFKRDAFISTSLKKDVAKCYYYDSENNKIPAVMLEIRVPNTASAMYIGDNSSFPDNEYELLINRNTTFRVIDKKEHKIVLEVQENEDGRFRHEI
ncbi:ADP-ribosyltransferase [Aerococcus vaginalis]